MGFQEYIKTMAENCLQVYEEMTQKKGMGTKIEQIQPPFSAANYKTAVVIPFGNKDQNIEGRFALGFNDERMAVKLAGAIAENMGMPAVDCMDDMATDILFEFMNTVAGKIITDWDQMGLAADFSPPKFASDLSFEDEGVSDLLIHSVTLFLEKNDKLSILSCVEEKENKLFSDKKVLVVDDSKMIRFLLTKEFEGQGYTVTTAENGLEGVISTQAFQPDLIIMDLVMPKMGGLEAIAKIREINPSVHIIILTSSSKKEEVIFAASHKIKGYIKKPIKTEQLLSLAQSCFAK